MQNKSVKKTLPQAKATHDWNALIDEWQKSNQTKLAFCQARGLVYHQFKYYYYQSCKKSSKKAITVTSNKDKACFIPVKITAPVTHGHYEIQLPSGIVIKVPLRESLASVIQALGAQV